MSILFLLIPLSLILLGVAIWAFFWAVDSNQFDDLSGPAYSILYDDDVKADKKPPATGSAEIEPEVKPSSPVSNGDSKQA